MPRARVRALCFLPAGELRRYEDLLRATTAIVGYQDIHTFRERFAEELQRFIAFDYVLVILLDPVTQVVHWRMFHAPGRKYLTGYDIRSSCVLPLTTVHRRLGVFAIGVSRPGVYSAEEVRFLSLVADHLALALDNALHLEVSREAQAELENKNDRLELALDLTNRLVSNLELRELLREVSGNVRRVMKCDAAAVALPEPEGSYFRVYALDFPESKGFLAENIRIPVENSPLGAAFRSGKVELRTKSQIQTDCPEACSTSALREGLRSGCFLPWWCARGA